MLFNKPQTVNLCNDKAVAAMSWKVGLWLFLFSPFFLTSCEPASPPPSELDVLVQLDIPPGIPEMEIEPGNELTLRRVQLGKKLFHDPYLSRDSSVSCASCHHQEKGFADFTPVSLGVAGRSGKRNAPALFNLGWHETYNRDGGTFTLETQMLVPFQDHLEMDMTLPEIGARIARDDEYPELFALAYPDHGVSSYAITRAVGAYERVLISFDSPYDRYIYWGEENALNASQKRGKELFFSDRTNCSSCHSGFDFRKQTFENNGLYAVYPDSGRTGITLDPQDRGKFKIPSLRNVEVTAPYMYDGSLWSLSEVIDHYASGGKGHPNQSPLISGFEISESEKTDLINFLMALTDHNFLSNPDLVP